MDPIIGGIIYTYIYVYMYIYIYYYYNIYVYIYYYYILYGEYSISLGKGWLLSQLGFVCAIATGVCLKGYTPQMAHLSEYLDLPCGEKKSAVAQKHWRRSCGTTPFLKINAVVRNCQPTWSGISAVWSGIFAVWSGIFAAEKRAWQQYIRRNSGLPKKVVLVQNLFIGQKAEIKPTLEQAGIWDNGGWSMDCTKKGYIISDRPTFGMNTTD